MLYVGRCRLPRGGPQTDSKTGGKKAHAEHIDTGNPLAHHLLSFLSLAQKGLSARVPTEMSRLSVNLLSLKTFGVGEYVKEDDMRTGRFYSFEFDQ